MFAIITILCWSTNTFPKWCSNLFPIWNVIEIWITILNLENQTLLLELFLYAAHNSATQAAHNSAASYNRKLVFSQFSCPPLSYLKLSKISISCAAFHMFFSVTLSSELLSDMPSFNIPKQSVGKCVKYVYAV